MKNQIQVAGDVCIDVVGVPKPARHGNGDGDEENWRLTGEIRTHYLRGGALLLADMVGEAAKGAKVVGPELETPLALKAGKSAKLLPIELFERLKRDEIVHSVLRAGEFPRGPKADKKDMRLRVAETHGFSGPEKDPPNIGVRLPEFGEADVLVLDDTGNQFRRSSAPWKQLMHPMPRLIIHKLHQPLPKSGLTSELWRELSDNHRDRTIVVVSADDLRSSGATSSRQLSWERSAREILWNLSFSKAFLPLAQCQWLLVRFGLEGVLCWHCPDRRAVAGKQTRAWLIYDPSKLENDFASTTKGEMVGFSSAFTAALAAALWRKPALEMRNSKMPRALETGIYRGLLAARALLDRGFGAVSERGETTPEYPIHEIFAGNAESQAKLGCVLVPLPNEGDAADPVGDWTILQALLPGGEELLKAATDLVLRNEASGKLRAAPLGVFGQLSTYDRGEIESYRAISNLIHEYLAAPAPKRPLCFAVFGPPGSGKSFGVQQVAESVAGDTVKLQKLVFNLSQFQSPDQLAPAFHLVRDAVLKGAVPLVFFDEFDSSLGGARLFWLKFLLAPMQDGEFFEQGVVHPIGKAIFVFAGGISEDYLSFIRPDVVKEGGRSVESFFKEVKGKDFISRLRGYLNIIGIEHREGYKGPALLRRAGVLRFQLKDKAPWLIDADGKLGIDPGVLRAFLHVRKFEHGVRSLEALIDMSLLSGRDSFDPGCLPSPDQLSLHVLTKQEDEPGPGFLELVRKEPSWSAEELEKIARAIHEHYLEERKKPGGGYQKEKASHQDWPSLDEYYKDSNRAQAEDIPRKLRSLGLDYARRGSEGSARIITARDLEEAKSVLRKKLDDAARSEHERWCAERRRQGWILGEKEDRSTKRHPDLKPWSELSETTKEKDLSSIRGIPRYLAAADILVIDKSVRPSDAAAVK